MLKWVSYKNRGAFVLKNKSILFAAVIAAFLLPTTVKATELDEEVVAIEQNIVTIETKQETIANEIEHTENQLLETTDTIEVNEERIQALVETLDTLTEKLEAYLSPTEIEDIRLDAEVADFKVNFFRRAAFREVLAEYIDTRKALQTEQSTLTLITEQTRTIQNRQENLIADAKVLEKEYQSEETLLSELKAKQKKLAEMIFQPPFAGSLPISSPFGYRQDPFGYGTVMHNGIDFTGAMGTPILAARDGVVVEAEFGYSQGNCVIIQHDNGYYSYYMHLTDISVTVGQAVSVGEQVGTMGTTGSSTGVHLHFGLSRGMWSDYVDPTSLIGLV